MKVSFGMFDGGKTKSLKKLFLVSMLLLVVAGVGFGIYSATRAITSDGATVSVSATTSHRGFEKNGEYPIYYGVNPTVDWKPWSTKWYKVSGNDAMCLQASKTSPNGNGAANIMTGNVANKLKQILLATVPSYSTASANEGGVNYYNKFKSYYDWDSKTAGVTNLRTRDTNINYSCVGNPAESPNCGCGTGGNGDCTRYADYYYGCLSLDYGCDKISQVDMTDAIFALGHMAASGTYGGDFYGISDQASYVAQVGVDISNWFYNNYPDAIDEYELYTVQVDSINQIVAWLEYKGAPKPTRARICKKSTSGANLSGATFSVGNHSYTTGSNGCTSYFEIDAARMTYNETEAPSGYVLYSANQTCTLTEFTDNTCNARANEPTPTAYIKIKKVNTENSGVSYAGLSVVGTVFSVKSGSSEVTTITIGSDGTGVTAKALPVGTYTISEKTATTGYKTNGATVTVALTSSNTASNPPTVDYTTSSTACTSGSNPCWFKNEPVKGKISLTKTGYEMSESGSDTTRKLGGVYFLATNSSDSSLTYCIGPTASNGSVTSGDIIYGTYTLKELTDAQAKANSKCSGASSTTSHNFAYTMLTISGVSVSSGTTTIAANKTQNSIPDNPTITTKARNSNASANPQNEIEISANAGVTDRITCSGLASGAKYQIRGELFAEGVSSAIKTATLNFTADSSGTCGNLDMTFSNIDTHNYMGKKLSIKQVLYKNNSPNSDEDWVRIQIDNASLDDRDEQVTVKTIEISTMARSERSREKELAVGIVQIKDTYEIIGMANGQNYTLKGTVKDSGGHIVATAEDNIQMTLATGAKYTGIMTFKFDSSSYVGQNLYVHQDLYLAGGTTPLASHAAPTDNDSQIVSVLTPAISTSAVDDAEIDSKMIGVGDAKVRDTVSYEGLVVSTDEDEVYYRLEGKIVDAATGAEISTATPKTFKASGENGNETMIFDVTTDALIGKRLVVYEYLFYGNNKIAEHVELTDTAQTVTVKTPTLGTTAADNADGDKLVEVDEGIKLKDTVRYDGLVAGNDNTYTLVMKVVLRSNPETELATGTKEFHTESPSGETEVVSAEFDATPYFGQDLVVFEYLYHNSTQIAKHEDKDDEKQIVTVKTPTIATTAYDVQNHTRELPVGTTTIIDEVEYGELVKDKTYTVTGTLIDKTTGQPVKDINNQDVTGSTTFDATGATGKVEITFSFFDTTIDYDYSAAEQKYYVAYEYLYKKGIMIAKHEDINDEAQSITINRPTLKTSATYKTDGTRLLGVGDVTMKDYVDYEGLVEGEWYEVVGSIIDPETCTDENDPTTCEILVIDDEYIRNSKVFKADEKGKGTVAIEINLNTISVQGRSFVVYERLYRSRDKYGDGRLLAVHEDLADENQTVTVKVAKIETTASDKADGDNVLNYEDGQVIHDVVEYDGLLRDEDYVLYGYLWDRIANEPLLDKDGKRIESTANFTTPSKKDSGTVEVDFNIDAHELPGAEIVVFEYLFHGNTVPVDGEGNPDISKVMAKHDDPESPSQTVRVSMRIGTTAADVYDGDQKVGVGGVKVTDTLAYEGARVGKTYKAKGWLVNQETGEKAQGTVLDLKPGCGVKPADDEGEAPEDGNEGEPSEGEGEEEPEEAEDPCAEPYSRMLVDIEGEKTFVIGEEGYERPSGTVVITFEFDSRNLIGKNLVVFEELYLVHDDGAEELVAEHKDLKDASQTITVATPVIKTIAKDKSDNDKELANNVDSTIVDEVEYSGLVPGDTYMLYGQLMNKKTGEALEADGTLFAVHEFTPTRDAGKETLEFTISTSDLSGQEIVVFETLYILPFDDEDMIAEHKDLNDNNQTVWVKVTKKPNTGLFTRLTEGANLARGFVVIGGAVVLIFGAWSIARIRKHRQVKF